jgi:hypothetical protein
MGSLKNSESSMVEHVDPKRDETKTRIILLEFKLKKSLFSKFYQIFSLIKKQLLNNKLLN